MKRFLSYVAVFAVGFGVCALVIYAYSQSGQEQGAKDVVAELESPAKPGSQPMSTVAVAAAKVSKAVVNIDTVGYARTVLVPGGPFGMFSEPQRVYPKGIASGVLIDKRGYILTNNHVVQDAAEIHVTLEDGRSFAATVLGKDGPSDLAILKVKGEDLPAAELGDSGQLHVGDWAIAVGNPLGFESSVSLGVISATARQNVQIGDETLERVIQTDAAINPGNSGGALANINGEVIGINSAIASTSGGSIGIGFAIPINSARQIAVELIDHGYVRRAWTGIIETISIARIPPDFRTRSLKYDGSDGVLIKSLYRGSPADKAGVEPYDIIVEIGGHKISTSDDLDSVVREMGIGAKVDVVFYRFGEKKTTKMRLTEGPADQSGSGG
jgi:S1-C subfamily serine protease